MGKKLDGGSLSDSESLSLTADRSSLSDSKRLAITAKLKDKIISACDDLSKFGEESAFFSVDMNSDLAFSTGSMIGRSFLNQQPEAMDLFYNYCKFRYRCHDKSVSLLLPHEVKQEDEREPIKQDDVTSTCNDVTDICDGVTNICDDVTDICDDVTNICGDVTCVPVSNISSSGKTGIIKNKNKKSSGPFSNDEMIMNSWNRNVDDNETVELWEKDMSNSDNKGESIKDVTETKNVTKTGKSSVLFNNINKLGNHMKLHEQEELYRCDVCNIDIFNKESYRIHMQLHNGLKMKKRKQGQKSLKNPGSGSIDVVAEDQSSRSANLEPQCQGSNTSQNSDSSNFTTNEKDHKNKQLVFTKFVQMSAKELGFDKKSNNNAKQNNNNQNKNIEKNEMKQGHDNRAEMKQHVCQVCGKSYTTAGYLKIHSLKHTKDHSYQCTNCCQGFPTEKLLNEHLEKICGNEGVLWCSETDDSILTANSQNGGAKSKRGRKRKHNDKNNSFTEKTKIVAIEHNNTQEDNKRLNGQTIEESQKSLNINEHEITCISSEDDDGEDKPLNSSDVDSDDEFNELLDNRQNKSSDNELDHENNFYSTFYKCHICGKFFIDQQSLSAHNEKHVTDKMFKCEVCGKGFIHHHNLTVHKRIHEGNMAK